VGDFFDGKIYYKDIRQEYINENSKNKGECT